MKVLYTFHWNCGRMGDLDGLFIADDSDVEKLIGKNCYFGEVLGKHSEIQGELKVGDFIIKTNDQDFIEKLEKYLGGSTISGYNPFDYINNDENV